MHHIELHLGPMFSGKTLHLNQLASKTLAVGNTVELWLPPLSEAGKRNAQKGSKVIGNPNQMVIRNLTNNQITAQHLASLHNGSMHRVDVVLIDETHFFDDQALVNFLLAPLPAQHPYTQTEFHCFGLNGTYQLTAWPTISALIPLASKIHHYQANCSRCGHKVKAGFSHLKQQPTTANNIKIEGGSDLYEALCHICMGSSLADANKE